jgi:ribosomal protein S18 acetylase RimI-like enzyme
MTDALTIRRAEAGEAAAIGALMGRAFQNDPVSGWLFPDPAERMRYQPSFFQVFVELTIADGLALVAEGPAGPSGVTLWLDVDPAAPDPDDPAVLAERLTGVLGPYAPKFFTLDALMTAQHPHDAAHAYLAFAAVDPALHGQGIGSALLSHRLRQLDADGRAAYLEASCARNAVLYERLGFAHLPKTLDLPEGPSLYPMWRTPR